MLTINLKNLRPEAREYLERVFQWLENVTKEPSDFHFKKALTWYLEDANKVIKYYGKESKKKKSKMNQGGFASTDGIMRSGGERKGTFSKFGKK